MTKRQIALIVLDGWGYREDPTNNAVAEAKTPYFDYLWEHFPRTLLEASGLAVGLPEGQMGNSEIGHTTIGAGKVIDTDLVRISKAIKSDEFSTNPVFKQLFDHVKKYNSTLHVKGLLGDGGVHSHQEHLHAFLRAAKNSGVLNVAIHVFTDGRDTSPQSASRYVEKLEDAISEIGIGYIATASGRFYAMDRDNNWDRLKRAEDAMWKGLGTLKRGIKPSHVIESLYQEGVVDEHLEPIVFLDDNGESYRVKHNDGVFLYNFRSDRMRMLVDHLAQKVDDENIFVVTMTEYAKDIHPKIKIAFAKTDIETTLAKEISEAGLSQAHIAETEKFPHATYFLNGGTEVAYLREKHIMLPSRKDVSTHDLAPKMRAEGIADKAIEELNLDTDFIFINFANPDMVGHTANVPAIVEALEEVDTQLKRVLELLAKRGGVAFVTADHGNAEMNIDPETGKKHTAHTINPVPAILTDEHFRIASKGTLADITPTILELFGLEQPASMTGSSLLEHN